MNKNEAIKLLNVYGEAWVKQDPDLILTIFTPDASYDDPKEPMCYGHEGIRNYWIKKVVNEEKDITFKLLNTWIDQDTIIAEWEAGFIDTIRDLRIKMSEVAILSVRDSKFSSLREYYKTEKTQL